MGSLTLIGSTWMDRDPTGMEASLQSEEPECVAVEFGDGNIGELIGGVRAQILVSHGQFLQTDLEHHLFPIVTGKYAEDLLVAQRYAADRGLPFHQVGVRRAEEEQQAAADRVAEHLFGMVRETQVPASYDRVIEAHYERYGALFDAPDTTTTAACRESLLLDVWSRTRLGLDGSQANECAERLLALLKQTQGKTVYVCSLPQTLIDNRGQTVAGILHAHGVAFKRRT